MYPISFASGFRYLSLVIQSAQIVLHIQREMALHLEYCASFGLSKEEMEKHPETIGKGNLSHTISPLQCLITNPQHALHTADTFLMWASLKIGLHFRWL